MPDHIPGIRSELRRLIRDVGGPSYRRLVDLASRAGDDLALQTIGDLIGRNAKGLPRLRTVEALIVACRRHHLERTRTAPEQRQSVPAERFELEHLAADHPGELALLRGDLPAEAPRPAFTTAITPPFPLGDIPARSPAFIFRQAIWERAQALLDDVRTFAYVGARGAGKTQLAAAHARHLMNEDDATVVWVTATSREEIVSGYRRLAERLDLVSDDTDDESAAQAALTWLSGFQGHGLLVLDNADDPFELSGWLPTTGQSRVIITTTNRSFADLMETVAVDCFTDEEAAQYLRSRTKLDGAGAGAVSGALGNLPLALAQAAAVIPLRGFSADAYLSHLRSTPTEEVFSRIAGYPRTLTQAVMLSLESISGHDRCRELVEAISLLDPAGAGRDVIQLLEAELRQGVAPGGLSSELVRFSLLSWSETLKSGFVHRVVARVIREECARNERGYGNLYWTAEALRLASLRDDMSRQWLKELLEQSSWVMAHALESQRFLSDDQVEWLLRSGNSLVASAFSQGLPSATFRACEALNRLAVMRLPDDAELALEMGSRYALALTDRGRLEAARLLADSIGDKIEATLGAASDLALEHRALQVRIHLADGDATTAVTIGRAALGAAEVSRDAADLRVVQLRNNLGVVLHELGLFDEEQELYVRSLTSCREELGSEHPLVMHLRNNLAIVLNQRGLRREASGLHRAVLESRRRVLGPLHPDTLISLSNLASTMKDLGDLKEARRLYEEVAAAVEGLYGRTHPATLTARANLASSYASLGALEEALSAEEEILRDKRSVLRDSHPSVLISMSNLAQRYGDLGRNDEGLQLLRTVVDMREESLGPEHPDTLTSRSNLAQALSKAGRFAEAVDLDQTTLAARRRVLGNEHPQTLLSVHNLANGYFAMGALSQAGESLAEAVDGMRVVLGERHPQTFAGNCNLFGLHVQAGDREAALLVLSRIAGGVEGLDRAELTGDQRRFVDLADRVLADPAALDGIMDERARPR